MRTGKFIYSLAITIITVSLSSCHPSSSPVPISTPAISLTPTENLPIATDTVMIASMPTQYLEFSTIPDLLRSARFQIMVPTDIPENLSFYKAWSTDYTNGDQNIRILYSEPGNALDANLKSLDIQMTMTDELVTRDSIVHQYKLTPLDVQEVQVRGQTGFTYWTQSGAAGNSACLLWREGNVNFSISLFGNWPPPGESNPHGLDNVLIMIANSLQIVEQ